MVSLHFKLYVLIIACLTVAFVPLVILSVSPHALDYVHLQFNSTQAVQIVDNNGGSVVVTLDHLSYGIWSYCWVLHDGTRACSDAAFGYSTTLSFANETSSSVVVPSKWTSALILHPITTVIVLLACIWAIIRRHFFKTSAALLVSLSLLLIVATFVVDVLFVVWVANELHNYERLDAHSVFGLGFCVMLIPFGCSVIAAICLCVGSCKHEEQDSTFTEDYDMSAPTVAPFERYTEEEDVPWWKVFKWAKDTRSLRGY